MAGQAAFQRTAGARLPTRHGEFRLESFRTGDAQEPHLAASLGLAPDVTPLVRIHSECITGDVFGSLRCDCGDQLNASLGRIAEAGSGLVIYLRQEGRGIGIENKLKAYALQEQGLDTVDANLALGLPVDDRSYDAAARYLHHLQIRRCILLTNNPDKVDALRRHGIRVTRAPLLGEAHSACRDYLATKRRRLGHDC